MLWKQENKNENPWHSQPKQKVEKWALDNHSNKNISFNLLKRVRPKPENWEDHAFFSNQNFSFLSLALITHSYNKIMLTVYLEVLRNWLTRPWYLKAISIVEKDHVCLTSGINRHTLFKVTRIGSAFMRVQFGP